MEAISTDSRVIRGGGFGGSGSEYPVSYRGFGDPDYDDDDYIGFRVALYL